LRWYGCAARKDENDWVKNPWITKWRVEVDQRKLGQKLWENTVTSDNYTRRMLWTAVNEEK